MEGGSLPIPARVLMKYVIVMDLEVSEKTNGFWIATSNS